MYGASLLQFPLKLLSFLLVLSAPAQTLLENHDLGPGHRIVLLKGFGDYFVAGKSGRPRLIKPEALSVNIVAVIDHVDGDRVWIRANGAGDSAAGWVQKSNAILLEDATSFFTARVGKNVNDWDAYLRRAEVEHALNQREPALADYTRAIELHPKDPFLYVRRGRHSQTMRACLEASMDFEEAVKLKPSWAEPYNLLAGVYANCPDPKYRDPQRAIGAIQRAIALDSGRHPTYLTVLALAYFQSGQLEKAVSTQREALASPAFPLGYRDEAVQQLDQYQRAIDPYR
jgi:tetratricopeptide (TPR) repeat protein